VQELSCSFSCNQVTFGEQLAMSISMPWIHEIRAHSVKKNKKKSMAVKVRETLYNGGPLIESDFDLIGMQIDAANQSLGFAERTCQLLHS